MKINFKYKLDMEWDNFQRGLHSKNHPGALPVLAEEMANLGLDYGKKEVLIDFVKNKTKLLKISPDDEIVKIKGNWRKIESESIKRLNELFEHKLSQDIDVYLTINLRCGYNIDQNYFFVGMLSKSTNCILLHELIHFYTYSTILPMFVQAKLPREQFNDYKEALTFLINTNFSDLIPRYRDPGYEKQKDLRVYLEQNWPKFSHVSDLSKHVIENYFN